MVCCTMGNCLSVADFPHQLNQHLLELRTTFQDFSQSEKHQFVLDELKRTSTYDQYDKFIPPKFHHIPGIATHVCITLWLAVLGLPLSTYYAIRKRFMNGERVAPVANRRTPGNPTFEAIAWMGQFFEENAEKLPQNLDNHLPSSLTKGAVYREYLKDMQHEESPNISESYFSRLWKLHYRHVKIPKVCRFSKCDECILIKIKLGETRNKYEREQLILQRERHLWQQSSERKKYWKHVRKAKENPERYGSLIIDGMDQSKTILPKIFPVPSIISKIWRLRVHLIGVIIHGIGVYGFFDVFQWPHGANLTLTCLITSMLTLHQIPPIIYIQMDNCGRENKNKYVIGFWLYLIQLGIVKKVKISFLMVGHTHEDVDRFFSTFSRFIHRKTITTLTKLMSYFDGCTSPNPIAVEVDHVFDISSWLENHLHPISGHSKPHCFKLVKINGKATLFYKDWSTTKNWTEPDGEYGGRLLKDMPVDTPDTVPPNFDKVDLEKVKTDIIKINHYMRKLDECSWWGRFIKEKEDEEENFEQGRSWPIDELIEKSMNLKPVPRADENIVQIQDEKCKVTIGKKKNKKKDEDKMGDFVLVDIPKYAGEWPQVGKKIKEGENFTTIQWYAGSKTTAWQPATKRDGRKRIPWTEDVAKSHIFFHFNLTSAQFMPKIARDEADKYASDY